VNKKNPLFSADRLLCWASALVVGTVILVWPRPGTALSLPEVIAATQNFYEKTADLKADFSQEVNIKSMKKTNREEGTFYFKKPRRMVWDYSRPKGQKMVINPQTMWLYVPRDNIVYVQNANEAFKAKAIVRFLSGWGKLTEDFDIAFAQATGLDKEGNYLLKLIPKERDFGVDEFFLTLDKDRFYISQLSFIDSYGNATRLLFRNIKVNNDLPEKQFSFTPPPGVEIYHNR